MIPKRAYFPIVGRSFFLSEVFDLPTIKRAAPPSTRLSRIASFGFQGTIFAQGEAAEDKVVMQMPRRSQMEAPRTLFARGKRTFTGCFFFAPVVSGQNKKRGPETGYEEKLQRQTGTE